MKNNFFLTHFSIYFLQKNLACTTPNSYCIHSISTCSLVGPIPTCTNTLATAPNTDGSCLCGTSACTTTAGFYCSSSENRCTFNLPGTDYYLEVTTGTCGSVANHASLGDMAACEAGKDSLQLGTHSSRTESTGSNWNPRGCYVQSGSLLFNTATIRDRTLVILDLLVNPLLVGR